MTAQGEAEGWTPLHHAAMHSHKDMVKLLLSHGADVNATDYVVGPWHYLFTMPC